MFLVFIERQEVEGIFQHQFLLHKPHQQPNATPWLPSRQAHVLDCRRISCAGASSALNMMLALLEHCGGAPLRLALELMHANIEDPIGIDEIAKHAGLSRRYLERLFRRHVQATPPRYYLELRLSHARQLLQHTSTSLTEVAVASGFVSFPHFCRRFRELFSIAPRQSRARSQGWVGRQEAVVRCIRYCLCRPLRG